MEPQISGTLVAKKLQWRLILLITEQVVRCASGEAVLFSTYLFPFFCQVGRRTKLHYTDHAMTRDPVRIRTNAPIPAASLQ